MNSKAKGPNRARAVAAARLAQQRVAERRRRALIAGVTAAVVLAIAVPVGIAIFNAQKPKAVGVPRNASSAGVTVGKADAKVTVDVYYDYLCPFCKRFEAEAASTLDKLAADGTAKVIYHPMAILDDSSSTRYSTRASSAAGCVAADGGPDAFIKFSAALFDKQPPEKSAGLPDSDLTAIAAEAGAAGAASCIKAHTYASWTAQLTEDGSKAGANSTPTVKVNGEVLDRPTSATLRAAVAKAAH